MTSAHTPTPWTLVETEQQRGAFIVTGADGESVTRLPRTRYHDGSADPEAIANAALIVRAINAHEALVEACQAALFAVQLERGRGNHLDGVAGWDAIERALEAALALAEGGAA